MAKSWNLDEFLKQLYRFVHLGQFGIEDVDDRTIAANRCVKIARALWNCRPYLTEPRFALGEVGGYFAPTRLLWFRQDLLLQHIPDEGLPARERLEKADFEALYWQKAFGNMTRCLGGLRINDAGVLPCSTMEEHAMQTRHGTQWRRAHGMRFDDLSGIGGIFVSESESFVLEKRRKRRFVWIGAINDNARLTRMVAQSKKNRLELLQEGIILDPKRTRPYDRVLAGLGPTKEEADSWQKLYWQLSREGRYDDVALLKIFAMLSACDVTEVPIATAQYCYTEFSQRRAPDLFGTVTRQLEALGFITIIKRAEEYFIELKKDILLFLQLEVGPSLVLQPRFISWALNNPKGIDPLTMKQIKASRRRVTREGTV